MWQWMVENPMLMLFIAAGLFAFGICGNKVVRYRERKAAENAELDEIAESYKANVEQEKS